MCKTPSANERFIAFVSQLTWVSEGVLGGQVSTEDVKASIPDTHLFYLKVLLLVPLFET